MSSKDLDSTDSDSVPLSLNDDFQKFLHEPLSTSSNESLRYEKPKIRTEKTAEASVDASDDGTRHKWLKKATGSAPEAEKTEAVISVETSKVQVIKRKESSSEENISESDPTRSEPIAETVQQASSLRSSINESFQAELQEAIDHSLQDIPSEDDYSSSFEKSISHKTSDSDSTDQSTRSTASNPPVQPTSSSSSHYSLNGNVNESLKHSDAEDSVQVNLRAVSELKPLSADQTEHFESHEYEETTELKPLAILTTTDSQKYQVSDHSAGNNIASSSNEQSKFSHTEHILPKASYMDEWDEEKIAKGNFEDAEPTLESASLDLATESEERHTEPASEKSQQFETKTQLADPINTLKMDTKPTLSKTETEVWSRLYPSPYPKKTSPDRKLSISTRSPAKGPSTKNVPLNTIIRGKSIRGSTTNRGRGARPSTGSETEVAKLKRQLNEQERLLNGFQAENEKLYEEMRSKNNEILVVKEAATKEREQLHWQIGNLKEKIRFFEFGQVTRDPDGSHHLGCGHLEEIKNLQNENDVLKKEVDGLTSQLKVIKKSGNSNDNSSKTNAEEVAILKEQLKRTEQMAADLQIKLTDVLHSEQTLKEKLNCFSQKQTSSQAVIFLEDQLKKIFQVQEIRDKNLKIVLDDVCEQQNIMKLAYEAALSEAEESFQKQRLALEIKLQEAQCDRETLHSKIPVHGQSKSTQCNLDSQKETQHTDKIKYQSTSTQCNINNSKKGCLNRPISRKNTQAKCVQCYLGDDISSSISLENKELKLRIERLILEHEDYKTQVENYLKEKDQIRNVKKLKLNISHVSTENQQRTVMESQQVMLEQLQKRLESIQGQWERQLNENASLKKQLQETMSQLVQAEEKCRGHQPGFKNILLLERKIAELEKRQSRREETLSELQFQAKFQSDKHLSQEISKWQEQVLHKNQIINQYQQELDTIIAFLYQLQQQNRTEQQNW